VKPFKVKEEFYYKLRFRENDPRLKFILLKDASEPPTSAVAWAVERQDGGRGFGFTGGHFFANWWVPEFRRLVLNAIAWSAKLEVPEGGVESTLEDPARVLILTGHNHPLTTGRPRPPRCSTPSSRTRGRRSTSPRNPEDLAGREARRGRPARPQLLQLGQARPLRRAKANVLKYLGAGGGLSVIHFANGAWNKTIPAKESDWEDYRTKIVRRVWMHPDSAHDPFGAFPVAITAVKHEITAGSRPSRRRTSSTSSRSARCRSSARDGEVQGQRQDEPMAWAYDVEKARVFQTGAGPRRRSIRGRRR
jgi:hypothetical protein